LIGCVPLVLLIKVPLNRLVALAPVELTAFAKLVAVNVQFEQINDPFDELKSAGCDEAVRVESVIVIVPPELFCIALSVALALITELDITIDPLELLTNAGWLACVPPVIVPPLTFIKPNPLL
jgi:hypothetical protein